jgi:hypothetical protein
LPGNLSDVVCPIPGTFPSELSRIGYRFCIVSPSYEHACQQNCNLRAIAVKPVQPVFFSGGSCCSIGVIDRTLESVQKRIDGGAKMNQNARRNLQRRKRQATRLSKREYFRKKKESAGGKDKKD